MPPIKSSEVGVARCCPSGYFTTAYVLSGTSRPKNEAKLFNRFNKVETFELHIMKSMALHIATTKAVIKQLFLAYAKRRGLLVVEWTASTIVFAFFLKHACVPQYRQCRDARRSSMKLRGMRPAIKP